MYSDLQFSAGLINALPPERRVALSQFDAVNASAEAYLQSGLYPSVIGKLNTLTTAAITPVKGLGRINFQSEDYVLDFNILGDGMLRETARNLTRVKAGSGFNVAQANKIRLTSLLCETLLRFDRNVFQSAKASLDFFFDHEIIMPGQTRTPRWHQHPKAARVYLVRPNATPEIIRDNAAQLSDTGRGLMANMGDKHKLPPKAYHEWEKQVKAHGMFFRAEGYEVVLISGRTWHRSRQVAWPEPSAFLALAVS